MKNRHPVALPDILESADFVIDIASCFLLLPLQLSTASDYHTSERHMGKRFVIKPAKTCRKKSVADLRKPRRSTGNACVCKTFSEELHTCLANRDLGSRNSNVHVEKLTTICQSGLQK